ncbi:rhodanese-like domain-containing protein [Gallaecimonas sp. GXIMD4217]|uniref:rhodanese-like domain-containing protein n=1 Tax=Gallaecimonas sp. GXIMD4217 TaxID=3131927 RepID=UPI00311B3E97
MTADFLDHIVLNSRQFTRKGRLLTSYGRCRGFYWWYGQVYSGTSEKLRFSCSMTDLTAFVSDHLVLSALWVILLIAFLVSVIQGFTAPYKKVAAQQAVFLINQDDTRVVDIRGQADFKKAHIAGAINLPKEQLLKNQLDKVEKHKNDPIILVCEAGMTAQQAAKHLHQQGFSSVYVLTGGIQGWKEANMPLKG